MLYGPKYTAIRSGKYGYSVVEQLPSRSTMVTDGLTYKQAEEVAKALKSAYERGRKYAQEEMRVIRRRCRTYL